MSGAFETGSLTLDGAAADLLLPMHLRFDGNGIIRHAGPGLVRLANGRTLTAQPVLDCLRVTRPEGVACAEDLLATAGQRLKMRFRDGREVRLRGIALPLADGEGGLISLALDLGELRDLGGAPMTTVDFSPTDMTVDMLYLIEANSAAMAESRRLISRLQGAKSAAETQAFTDTLTGLANRRALDRILRRSIIGREGFTLCHIDLDYFKAVNDTHGHAAGDHVLISVAETLRTATRVSDTVARVGGDEFVVVLHGTTDSRVIDIIAQRIITGICQPIVFENNICRISTSIGSAISTRYATPEIETMMADADAALYASKEAGRGCHHISEPSRGKRTGGDLAAG